MRSKDAHRQAMAFLDEAALHDRVGRVEEAAKCRHEALHLEFFAAQVEAEDGRNFDAAILLRGAAEIAVQVGDGIYALELVESSLSLSPPEPLRGELLDLLAEVTEGHAADAATETEIEALLHTYQHFAAPSVRAASEFLREDTASAFPGSLASSVSVLASRVVDQPWELRGGGMAVGIQMVASENRLLPGSPDKWREHLEQVTSR